MSVYLRLKGPNSAGLNEKGCYHTGWTVPAYKGIDRAKTPDTAWIGLRLDQLVLVDCDDDSAKDAWLAYITQPLEHTWVRKSPRGYHFVYERTAACARVVAKVPWTAVVAEKMDLKTGTGHLMVVRAPGYEDIADDTLMHFDPAWFTTQSAAQSAPDEYDEVPLGSGRGNAVITSLCGSFRRLGFSEKLIAESLRALNPVIMPTAPMKDEYLDAQAKWIAGKLTGSQ